MPRPSNKDRILDAAEAVATKLGAAHLTLDAVAERAKVTKGGLLYHFRDKEELLVALMERYLKHCAEKRMRLYNDFGGGPAGQVKAMIHDVCDGADKPVTFHNTLVTACATMPNLLEPVRAAGEISMDNIRKNFKDPAAAFSLALAAHGLMFMELLNYKPYSAAERKAVVDYLLKETDNLTKPGGKDTMHEVTEALTVSLQRGRKSK